MTSSKKAPTWTIDSKTNNTILRGVHIISLSRRGADMHEALIHAINGRPLPENITQTAFIRELNDKIPYPYTLKKEAIIALGIAPESLIDDILESKTAKKRRMEIEGLRIIANALMQKVHILTKQKELAANRSSKKEKGKTPTRETSKDKTTGEKHGWKIEHGILMYGQDITIKSGFPHLDLIIKCVKEGTPEFTEDELENLRVAMAQLNNNQFLYRQSEVAEAFKIFPQELQASSTTSAPTRSHSKELFAPQML